jgi:uncharacterized protein YacL
MDIIPFTTHVYTDPVDPKNILVISIEAIFFGISGLILGTIVNKLFTAISKKYKNNEILISILQIAFSGALLGFLYIHVSSFFTNHFQRTLSGLAFPAFFYGIQSNIFLAWHHAYWKLSI